MIPYGRQNITEADKQAVLEVLGSDFLTQGPAIPAFEAAVAAQTGAAHAVAATSATASLHLACLALGLGEGDWLWTSPNSFVASANCGLYCGAQVDFVDIQPGTWNMCPDALEAKLVQAAKAGKLPKILIPVHFSGQSCDMERIAALCKPHGIRIIEDASHAVGASYKGAPVGNCAYADIAVFSYHPVKIITTGEGGVATTQSDELAEKMRDLRSHGITRDAHRMVGASDGPWYYQQVALGLNYRMTDIQAALGRSQMARLPDILDKRLALADRYDALLADLPLRCPARMDDTRSSWHLYVIRLDDPSRRRAVFEALRDAGIGVNVHYIPIHLQPWYRNMGFKEGDFPAAEAYYAGAITLPLYPELSAEDQDIVVSALKNILTAEPAS